MADLNKTEPAPDKPKPSWTEDQLVSARYAVKAYEGRVEMLEQERIWELSLDLKISEKEAEELWNDVR